MLDFLFNPVTRGIKLMRQGNYADALAYFQGLAEQKKSLSEAYFNIGKCYLKLGKTEEMKDSFHRALEFKTPDSVIRGILEVTNWKILAPNTCFNSSPAFSPDGKLLAYVSSRRDTNGDGQVSILDCSGIYLVDLGTGTERCIVADTAYNFQPVFMKDGKRIAYLSVRPPVEGGTPSQNDNPTLYLLNIETGEEVELLGNENRTKYFVFTPNEDRLIFSCWKPGEKKSGIYALNMATRSIDTLVPDTFESTFPSVSPVWGDRLVYSSWRRDTNGDGAVDVHDNSAIFVKHIVEDVEVCVAGDQYNNSFPSFAPDGQKVFYLSIRRDTNRDGRIDLLDNSGIYLYDLVARTEKCLVKDTFFNKFPAMTADGKKLIFISNWRNERAGDEDKYFFEKKGIYVLDVPGGRIDQVVSDKFYGSRSPVLSPDGTRVAYVSWKKGTNRGLYLANLDRLPTKEELHEWIDKNI